MELKRDFVEHELGWPPGIGVQLQYDTGSGAQRLEGKITVLILPKKNPSKICLVERNGQNQNHICYLSTPKLENFWER